MTGTAPLMVPMTRLDHGRGLPLPTYATPGAAGLDLMAAVAADAPVTLPPGGRALVPTGIALALPIGFEAQIRPRSGLALRHGVTVLNTPGTIDSDYRGEIQIILINHAKESFTVTRGMRIAQMVLAEVVKAKLEAVDNLDGTRRGSGGFGHTGH